MEDNGADENTLKAGESFHILYFFFVYWVFAAVVVNVFIEETTD